MSQACINITVEIKVNTKNGEGGLFEQVSYLLVLQEMKRQRGKIGSHTTGHTTRTGGSKTETKWRNTQNDTGQKNWVLLRSKPKKFKKVS